MGTTVITFDNLEPQIWKLAATGADTAVIISSNNGPGEFFHNTANAQPATQEGHPIREGEALTFNVKTGEFLFVKAKSNTKIFVST